MVPGPLIINTRSQLLNSQGSTHLNPQEKLFISVNPAFSLHFFSNMRLDNHGYVSIVELIVYIPCLILGFMVCLRHGFKRGSGWIFVLILSAIRIAGSICQLLTYNNPTEGLFKATAILESIGIAPLLLVVLGVLSRL